ncbi:NADPH2:quinone reductase [Oxalobacteraceae bacterium GrIS 1.11]
MRAIVIQQFGGAEQLVFKDLPKPQAKSGEVVIRVKAFGLNRAELSMRNGTWGEVAPVSGIECVGVVESDPDRHFVPGQQVAALMGGMGRSINGSYAEYTCLPATNVVALNSTLSWQDLAALPESYATAWSCLYDNLAIQAGQLILIRGAASALGQAAMNIAAHAGLTVLATTRSAGKIERLKALGASDVLQDSATLSQQLRERYPSGVDAVLDIVGNSSILDSLKAIRRNGRACLAGFLGGPQAIPAFNPLQDMPSGVHLSFFASFMLGSKQYPLSRIPFQTIADRAAAGLYQAKPVHVHAFDAIQDAHRLMETNGAGGKQVILL